MNLAKAQTVAQVASTAGYNVKMVRGSADDWTVQVVSQSLTIDAVAAAALATAQNVTAKIALIEFQ